MQVHMISVLSVDPFPQVLFLPFRDEFHPKRNQARQKLSTLLASRFDDLSSDVFFELARRYPEFKEDLGGIPWLSRLESHDIYRRSTSAPFRSIRK